MTPITRSPQDLLEKLEASRTHFGPAHSALVLRLLSQLSKHQFTGPDALIRFHECLLFRRAFPSSASEVDRVESILAGFHRRVEKLQSQADMSSFDGFDTSGVSGTTM